MSLHINGKKGLQNLKWKPKKELKLIKASFLTRSGNLVTPKFWDDTWLNEGFATYMKYEGINAVQQNWNVWEKLVLDEIQDVLSLDSLKSTHAISGKLDRSIANHLNLTLLLSNSQS